MTATDPRYTVSRTDDDRVRPWTVWDAVAIVKLSDHPTKGAATAAARRYAEADARRERSKNAG